MEKRFHLFVRRHPGGAVTASVIGYPHLASFAPDITAARADLEAVLVKLLERDLDGLSLATTSWPRLELRRVDITLRARQHRRLLPVPMRFTVLLRPEARGDKAPKRDEPIRGPVTLMIPRLGIVRELDDVTDLDAYVEELIRHALFMVPFTRLREVAYEGTESVEPLLVRYKPLERKEISTNTEEDRPDRRRPDPLPPGLAEAARRLNDAAAAGMIDRAFQRDADVARLVELLTLARRASVLLVGESGVGKSALVHELAHRAAAAEQPAPLAGMEIYSTSGARIVAGMRYLGEWQARLQRMVASLRTRKAVLHIESLPEFLAAFAGTGGLDGAQYLLPAVESGELTLIVEATPDDVARAERTHAPFVQSLRAVVVRPLDRAGAWLALTAAAQRVARSREVKLDPAALRTAAELTERFGGALPGAAVALVRAAASETAAEGPRTVGAKEVVAAFGRRTGYPPELVDPTVPMDPDAVLARLRARVVGQDDALRLLRDLIVTLKTSMGDPRKPLGSFLLLGPTGVGKTESALCLAEYLFGDAKRLTRFDMSEYADPGGAARLVGLYGAEGALARKVREQPFGVLLFDEVEKADGGVHDLLLQVLGEGRITDATGRTVDLRNAIVVMTSNLGADTAGRATGFNDPRAAATHEAHYRAAAAAFFRPELMNRIDHVVPYRPLDLDTIRAIARRALDEALAREGVARRGVTVRYDDAVIDALAALGVDPRYGARPLKRTIERVVVAPLAGLLAASGSDPPKFLRLRADKGAVVVDPADR